VLRLLNSTRVKVVQSSPPGKKKSQQHKTYVLDNPSTP
jgi:hypothetical protein